jgi:hypothetical protein
MNDQKVEVSLSLMNAVLQYLGSKPFQEVFQLVNAIHEQVQPQIQMPAAVRPDEAAKPVTDAA